MKSGGVDGTNTKSIIYRGIENIYANVWQFVDGIYTNGSKIYISYDPSKYSLYDNTNGYSEIGYSRASSKGYTSKLGFDAKHPLVGLPIEVNGNTTNYISDYFWPNSSQGIVFVGGYWAENATRGLFSFDVSGSASTSYNFIGARLLKTV